MTAIEGLVRRIQGEVRKSWVDYFKTKEMIQIRDAFDSGVYHANNTPKVLQATGMDYYHELVNDSSDQDEIPD